MHFKLVAHKQLSNKNYYDYATILVLGGVQLNCIGFFDQQLKSFQNDQIIELT